MKMEWKTRRVRIRNQTIRMGLRIIPLKEAIQLAQLRWFRHVVRTGDEILSKIAWRAGTEGKRPKGRPRQTWREGIRKILKERGSD
jgi:hypothetical protein